MDIQHRSSSIRSRLPYRSPQCPFRSGLAAYAAIYVDTRSERREISTACGGPFEGEDGLLVEQMVGALAMWAD